MKPVTETTRAKKVGTQIVCPNCHKIGKVFHFAWSALSCQSCGEMVEKTDWSMLEPFKDESIFQGVLEFDAPTGERVLAESTLNLLNVKVSILRNGAWVYDRSVYVDFRKFTPKAVWNSYFYRKNKVNYESVQ